MSVGADDYIFRLEVSEDDPAPVQGFEGAQDLADVNLRPLLRQPSLSKQQLPQVAPRAEVKYKTQPLLCLKRKAQAHYKRMVNIAQYIPLSHYILH